MKSVSLFYKKDSSDKEYNVFIQEKDDGYVVNFSYGRRGNANRSGTKTEQPVSLKEAELIYDKLVSKQIGEGYVANGDGKPFSGVDTAGRNTGLFPMLLNPISKSEMSHYINDPNWLMQEKYDGKRIMVSVKGGVVVASNRKGLSIGIPQELENDLAFLQDCVIDGELIGSTYYVFDMIELENKCLRNDPYKDRILRLCDVIQNTPSANGFVKVADTFWHKQTKADAVSKLEEKEGVVFKDGNSPWRSGRPNSGGDQFKCKFWESATVKVMAVNEKRSVSIGVLDGNTVVNVGNVSIPPNYEIPKAGDMCEVKYLHAFRGGSIYQPIYKGLRDDKDLPDEINSLKYKVEDN